jgi:hypothetical protein
MAIVFRKTSCEDRCTGGLGIVRIYRLPWSGDALHFDWIDPIFTDATVIANPSTARFLEKQVMVHRTPICSVPP